MRTVPKRWCIRYPVETGCSNVDCPAMKIVDKKTDEEMRSEQGDEGEILPSIYLLFDPGRSSPFPPYGPKAWICICRAENELCGRKHTNMTPEITTPEEADWWIDHYISLLERVRKEVREKFAQPNRKSRRRPR